MKNVLGLKCALCGAEYRPGEVDYVCPRHGDDGILDVVYDYRAIGKAVNPKSLRRDPDRSVWRYRELMPLSREALERLLTVDTPLRRVGGTPLYRADRLAATFGLSSLYLKDDGRLPTASFKDRASSMAVAKAVELGAEIVTTASSGNAASALAGMAAGIGLPTIIFVPQTAPTAKVAQLLIFGSTVILVEGNYDQAFDLALAASKEFGWYCRSTAYNPYTREGKKTCSLEICEQLNWHAPDRLFVSVGDGNIISGLHKGLRDLVALGWIDRMPKLMGVQAAGSAVLADAFSRAGEEFRLLSNPETIADSISVGIPRDRVMALRAVRQTGGEYLVVTDEEILEAMRVLARQAAIFAEPAGAAGFAGLQRAVAAGKVKADERIAVVITGNGLKDVASASKATGQPYRVAPNLESLKPLVAKLLAGRR